MEQPFLVASARWDDAGLPAAARWSEIPSHRIAVPAGVDGILAAGGGSAIDTAKAASAASGLPLVSVPTTYSGAEWTEVFGVRDPGKRMVGGGGGANLAGIVYEPELTLDLPRPQSGGTAMNALAHCVEALYRGDLDSARRGAALIVEWLPRVLENLRDLEARTHLLEGAAAAGEALAAHGLYLGHAMAQAIGGRYGLPHGALNAICLPAAMRFNADVAPLAPSRAGRDRGRAGTTRRLHAPSRSRSSRRRPGRAGRLAAVRPGARANPRPAAPRGDRRAAALYLVAGLFVSPPKLRLNQPLGVPTRKDRLHGQARRALPRREVVLGAAIAFLIVSFFNWQEVDLGAFGEAGVSMWDGIGWIAGLLAIALIVWQAIRLANINLEIGIGPAMVTTFLAALLLLFTVIKFFADSEFRTWAAWVGLILAIVVAAGAWLNMKMAGESIADLQKLGGSGWRRRSDTPPSTPSQTPPPPRPRRRATTPRALSTVLQLGLSSAEGPAAAV